MSLEDYDKMFKEQEGCCKLCSRPQEEVQYKLHVDHSHETGRVRGLLCRRCNTYLGILGDNEEAGRKVYDYLKES